MGSYPSLFSKQGRHRGYSSSSESQQSLRACFTALEKFKKQNPSFEEYQKQFYKELYSVEYKKNVGNFFHSLLKVRANELYNKCSEKGREIEYGSILNCENKVHDMIEKQYQIISKYYDQIHQNPMLCFKEGKTLSQCAEQTAKSIEQKNIESIKKWSDIDRIIFNGQNGES